MDLAIFQKKKTQRPQFLSNFQKLIFKIFGIILKFENKRFLNYKDIFKAPKWT